MIHRICIQNFKSISEVRVELGHLTVLVGKSGTGKSNFVEAIRCLRDTLYSDAKRNDVQKVWAQLLPATNKSAIPEFEIEFSIIGLADSFIYALKPNASGPNHIVQSESLYLGKKCLFHQTSNDRNKSTWANPPDLIKPPAAGAIALGRIPSIPEVVIAFTALTSGIGCHTFPDDVLSGRRVNSPARGLDDNAINYLDTLKEIVSNLQDLKVRMSIAGALQRINASVISAELNDVYDPTYVVVGHNFQGKTLALPLSQESVGFRRFYAHLLALYQSPPKQTLLFEHPEDGIHPGALSILAEEFKVAPQNGRGQIILTTHSPILLDHFDAEQIRVVELRGFETQIGMASAEQREAINENLLATGELLTVDPARIDAPVPEETGA